MYVFEICGVPVAQGIIAQRGEIPPRERVSYKYAAQQRSAVSIVRYF